MKARRRGNTIVLVTALLVLLVIIAAAYITRVQEGRRGARAVLDSTQRDSGKEQIAEALAREVSLPLFVAPVDAMNDPDLQVPGGRPSSNHPRLSPLHNAQRYGIDLDFPFNFAPYSVVPFTNWPDPSPSSFGDLGPLYPAGPGNPGGGTISDFLDAESNPFGGPGFGDTRWLADTEPLRWNTRYYPQFEFYQDALSHWRHVSYPPRPNNGWRLATDISDLFDRRVPSDGLGGLLMDLSIPVEQWLAVPPTDGGVALRRSDTGETVLPLDIEDRFRRWFFDYANTYTDTDLVPPNFLKLADLDGDDVIHEAGERPEDEFDLTTARGQISRFLADADGDGYTDSFWFLAPTPTDRDIRQIVAVRIIDNGGLLNANVASRFSRQTTGGLTLTDLALVGENVNVNLAQPMNNWNAGPFDIPAHDELMCIWPPLGQPGGNLFGDTTMGWVNGGWCTFVLERGYFTNCAANPLFDPAERLFFWQNCGRMPFTATGGFTPFGLSDELELRMFHGNNYPWIVSRFERAVQTQVITQTGRQILHANVAREEASEAVGEQLRNREQRYTLRNKLTLFSGARNDELPPWLWWDLRGWPFPADVDDGDPDTLSPLERAFSRPKVDLRSPPSADPTAPLSFERRLDAAIMLALTEGDDLAGSGYFGSYDAVGGFGDPVARDNTRRLGAALKANILAWRDVDADAPLDDAVPLPQLANLPADDESKFLGMEAQPFLLECFIGHVYEAMKVTPAVDPQLQPYGNGNHYLVGNSSTLPHTTVVVIQLANPFDRTVDLRQYYLTVFGQTIDLSLLPADVNTLLDPATDDQPVTAILYAIDESLGSSGFGSTFKDNWIDFLDIEASDHPGATLRIDLHAAGIGPSIQRGPYDSFAAADGTLVLFRRDPVLGSPDGDVVIDRFDGVDSSVARRKLLSAHEDLEAETSSAGFDLTGVPPPGVYDIANPGEPYPGLSLVLDLDPSTNEIWHWAQWVRATRAWGADIDVDGSFEADERNPRYVFGDYVVTVPEPPPWGFGPDPTMTESIRGNKYMFGLGIEPDTSWFKRWYNPPIPGPTNDQALHKPTFFDMRRNVNDDFTVEEMPDKGWYAQPGPTEAFSGSASTSRLDFSMQMLQKDGNFEQVGELLNVWLFGHEVQAPDSGSFNTAHKTLTTFSEFMTDAALVGDDHRVNRLRPRPQNGLEAGRLLGLGDPADRFDLNQAFPDLPAVVRLLDAFVCDGKGLLEDFNDDGNVGDPGDLGLWEEQYFSNAQGFNGEPTYGLININTASLEVLRAMPHMWRLIYRDVSPATPLPPLGFPRSGVAEATIQFRERFDGDNVPTGTGQIGGPDYSAGRYELPANFDEDDVRSTRGLASPHEVLGLDKPATFGALPPTNPAAGYEGLIEPTGGPNGTALHNDAWRIDGAAWLHQIPGGSNTGVVDESPADHAAISAWLASDRQNPLVDHDNDAGTPLVRIDLVAGDAEEANLLYAGISNLITSRSDLFTVYFKVRTFRQDPETGFFNALDRENIIDDSRYVMLVDRSRVEHPSQPPRILYLEKLPR